MTKEEIAKELIGQHEKTISWDAGDLVKLEENITKWLGIYAQQQVKNTVDLADVSGSFIEEAKKLLIEYRDEQMPDWNTPYHYDAEGWASMKYFMQWLDKKSNDR